MVKSLNFNVFYQNLTLFFFCSEIVSDAKWSIYNKIWLPKDYSKGWNWKKKTFHIFFFNFNLSLFQNEPFRFPRFMSSSAKSLFFLLWVHDSFHTQTIVAKTYSKKNCRHDFLFICFAFFFFFWSFHLRNRNVPKTQHLSVFLVLAHVLVTTI